MADFEESHKVIGVVTYSLAAVLGVVAANYYESWTGVGNTAYGEIIGGLVGLVIPIWVLKTNEGMGGLMGPVRMLFGVFGLTLVLRGLIGVNGIMPQAGLGSAFNPITS